MFQNLILVFELMVTHSLLINIQYVLLYNYPIFYLVDFKHLQFSVPRFQILFLNAFLFDSKVFDVFFSFFSFFFFYEGILNSLWFLYYQMFFLSVNDLNLCEYFFCTLYKKYIFSKFLVLSISFLFPLFHLLLFGTGSQIFYTVGCGPNVCFFSR